MQAKDNYIKCQTIKKSEMNTTNICKCVLVKRQWYCTHCVVEWSWEEWQGVILLLKDVKTSMCCICSSCDLCMGLDAEVGSHNPHWQCGNKWVVHYRPPVIYVGGLILDDDEIRRFHGQHIHTVEVAEVEAMVDTLEVFSHLLGWDATWTRWK